MNLLIVEDDNIIREGIRAFLEESGYKVFAVETAEKGLEFFLNEQIHLLVLDIMLPKMNGIEMLRAIRNKSNVPVIMLTALSDEQTQIKLFDEYADDYLTKPFSLVLLRKRIEAQIRRYYISESFWIYGKAKVDFKGFIALYDEKEIKLTTKEFKLLQFLIENKGITVRRSQILDKLWSFDDNPYERVIDVYIKNLRQKLKLDCIITVKGVGYKMENK